MPTSSCNISFCSLTPSLLPSPLHLTQPLTTWTLHLGFYDCSWFPGFSKSSCRASPAGKHPTRSCVLALKALYNVGGAEGAQVSDSTHLQGPLTDVLCRRVLPSDGKPGPGFDLASTTKSYLQSDEILHTRFLSSDASQMTTPPRPHSRGAPCVKLTGAISLACAAISSQEVRGYPPYIRLLGSCPVSFLNDAQRARVSR